MNYCEICSRPTKFTYRMSYLGEFQVACCPECLDSHRERYSVLVVALTAYKEIPPHLTDVVWETLTSEHKSLKQLRADVEAARLRITQ